MKKLLYILLLMVISMTCFVFGFSKGLDQKETMKQSFRTALYQAEKDLKSLKLQSQVDVGQELHDLTFRSLEQKLQSMVMVYMTEVPIGPSTMKDAQDFLNNLNTFTSEQQLTLYANKKHWAFDESVSFINSGLDAIAKGEPANRQSE